MADAQGADVPRPERPADAADDPADAAAGPEAQGAAADDPADAAAGREAQVAAADEPADPADAADEPADPTDEAGGRPGQRVAGVAGFVLVVQAVAAAVASYAEWPSDRPGAPVQPVGVEWITAGSAISPSLRLWVLLVVIVGLGLAARFVAELALAAAALALLAAVTLGRDGLAEIRAPDAGSAAPVAVLWVSGVVSLGLAAALAWAAIHEVIVVRRVLRRSRAQRRGGLDMVG